MGFVNSKARLLVEIGIVILQTIIVLFLLDIRSVISAHETRLDGLDQFANRGDRWTLVDQRDHEREVEKDVKKIRSDISAIRVEMERIRR